MTPLDRYLAVERQLRALEAAGQGQTEAADDARDEAEVRWGALTAEEQAALGTRADMRRRARGP